MFPVSRTIDRYDTTFDHDSLIANAGLIVIATLMARLGLERLVNTWVRTGFVAPGRKLCTLIAAMLAGATHIDHVDVLHAGATYQQVLPFKVMAPSTIGTFLRTFTFGFVRQLDAVAARLLAKRVGSGRRTRRRRSGHRLGLHRLRSARPRQGRRRVRLHEMSRLSPARRDTRRDRGDLVLTDAQRIRRIIAWDQPVHRRTRRHLGTREGDRHQNGPGRFGVLVVELLRTLDRHRMAWSITVTNNTKVQAAIANIAEDAWTDIDYTQSGFAQVAETTYVGGGRRKKDRRTVRLVVRRTRLADTAQARLFPTWRHHSFITNRHDLDTVEADRFWGRSR